MALSFVGLQVLTNRVLTALARPDSSTVRTMEFRGRGGGFFVSEMEPSGTGLRDRLRGDAVRGTESALLLRLRVSEILGRFVPVGLLRRSWSAALMPLVVSVEEKVSECLSSELGLSCRAISGPCGRTLRAEEAFDGRTGRMGELYTKEGSTLAEVMGGICGGACEVLYCPAEAGLSIACT